MDQTSAQVALQPYLALAKSATSPRAASDLITQATSAQGTYVFAELLAHNNIANLKDDSQYSSHHTLLEVFTWGTWETYHNTADLPKLSDAQALKLRLLSLISYASEKQGDLSYSTLCRRLGFDTAIDLEHLVTSAIYLDLITAVLDPSHQTVLIHSVAPLRDLVPGSVKSMLSDLEMWSQRCDSVLADLEKEIAKVKAEATKRSVEDARTERQIKQATDAVEKGAHNTGSTESTTGNAAGSTRGKAPVKKEGLTEDELYDDDDPMEIDTQSTGPRKKSGILDKLRGK